MHRNYLLGYQRVVPVGFARFLPIPKSIRAWVKPIEKQGLLINVNKIAI